jgi:hypothetical protein
MDHKTRRKWAALNTVGLAVALVLNGLANALPLNGRGTGELSDLYPNLFVPAGLTFAVWGVIYLWLMAFVGYGFALIGDERGRNPLALIGPWFLVNCLANAAWIVAWHWLQVVLALALMGVILGSLIAMYLRLGVGAAPAPAKDRWLVHAPVSLYMGWITVATIANITALAVDLGAPAFGGLPAALTVAVMAAALLITARMLQARRDVVFALVVSWAFLGIYLKRSGAPEEGSGLVAGFAVAGLVALGLGVVRAAATRRKAVS